MALSQVSLTGGMRQNLMSLQKTSDLMERTQKRLSTGMKIQTALDDPINYFAAKGHKDRAADLAYRKDEMNEGVQLLKASDAGIEGTLDLIAAAKSIAQSARSSEGTTEINALEEQYNAIRSQIDTLTDDSGYKGVNLLTATTAKLDVFFDEDGQHKITLSGVDITASGLSVSAAASDSWHTVGVADATAIDADIVKLDTARDTLRTAAKTFSNNMSTITIRQDFTSNMINTLQDGAAKLTEADLNEEGANMLMLQTRQSLGTQSLSLASQAAQSVMRLF